MLLLGHGFGRWGRLRCRHHYLKKIVFSPDGTELAVCTVPGDTLFFAASDYRQIEELRTEEGLGTIAIAYAPSGDEFVTVGGDQAVAAWDASTRKMKRKFARSPDWIGEVSFSSDGKDSR